MNETIQYLDYAGLTKFKEEIDKVILANKNDIIGVINEVSGDIGNGTLTIKKNNTSVGTFTANQKTNADINITVPTALSDLTFGLTTVNEIINIIKYGQLDISSLTDAQKTALHETIATSFGYMSQTALATQLEGYGTTINYDSSTQKVLLKNGNTVLSEFSAAAFIKDGMISSISITDGTGTNSGKKVLLIDFNADSGITDIEIPIEDIFDASKYTKTEDLATVATSGSYSDLSNTPATLTLTEVNTGTDTTGKLVTAKIIKDTVDNAIYGGGSSSGTVITTTNISSEGLSAGFAKSVQIGTSTPVTTDTNGKISLPAYPDISGKANSSDLATVATSGSYNDLSNTPTIVSGVKIGESGSTISPVNGIITLPEGSSGNVLANWNETDSNSEAYIQNKPTIATPSSNGIGGTNGLLSAQDKEKLNGIEAGADVTDATNVKAALNVVTTSQGKYLKDDGTWDTPQDTTYVFNTAYDATTNKVATMADIPSVPVSSVAGKTGAVTLAKGDVGLGNVDNTADANKSVNYANSAGSTEKVTIDNTITYGRSDLQYQQGHDNSGSDPTKFQNPDTDWWSHLVLNHANGQGYYNDIAICFHKPEIKFRRVESGTNYGWYSVITSDNIGSQSVNYATTAGSAPANGGNSSTVNGHSVNSDVPANAVFTDTWRPLGTGANDACAGNDSRLSDSRPASDVYSWAKQSTKPSYAYSEVGYSINKASISGAVSNIDGSIPLHLLTVTAVVTSFALSTQPAYGHSCHVIFTATSELTVSIAHNSTYRICPDGAGPVDLTIPANGYVEVDFINLGDSTNGDKVFVRGV